MFFPGQGVTLPLCFCAFALWQRENSTLDQLLTDLTDLNEGFKTELELMCGQKLQFSEIVEADEE